MVGGPRLSACTVTTAARMPEAMILERSFRPHHSGIPFLTVVIDHDWYVTSVLEWRRTPAPEAPSLSGHPKRIVSLSALDISEHTVRTHLKRVYRHLGVANRVELARAL